MSHSKNNFRLLVILPALLSAAACAPGSTTPNTSQETPAPTQIVFAAETLPKDEDGNPLVARVNDQVITLDSYERALLRFQQQPVSNPAQLPKLVLDTMVQQMLIDQAAAANEIVIPDELVDQELQGLVQSAGGDQAWQLWLTANFYTETELRQALHSTLLTNQMRDRITTDLNGSVAQVHARHILVATQEEANDLLVRLRNGEDFEALAAQHSLDTSTANSGGDLGWFTHEELLEPTLAEVAFTVEPGQVAGPVQTSLGYHVIQSIERAVRPVDPAKRAQLAQSRFERWLESLTVGARVETYL